MLDPTSMRELWNVRHAAADATAPHTAALPGLAAAIMCLGLGGGLTQMHKVPGEGSLGPGPQLAHTGAVESRAAIHGGLSPCRWRATPQLCRDTELAASRESAGA
jgi:hypothetical protein